MKTDYSIDDVMELSKVKAKTRRLVRNLSKTIEIFEKLGAQAEEMLINECETMTFDSAKSKELIIEFSKKLEKIHEDIETEYNINYEDILKMI